MKYLIIIILFFLQTELQAQVQRRVEKIQLLGTKEGLIKVQNSLAVDGFLYLPVGDTSSAIRPTKTGAQIIYSHDLKTYTYDSLNNRWLRDSTGGSGGTYDSAFNANRPITREISGLEGVNLNKDDIKATLEELLYPTQKPIVTIDGGEVLELMSNGAGLSKTLSFYVSRQGKTNLLQTVIVAGSPYVGFDNSKPPPYGESSITIVSVPRNTSSSYSIVAITNDGKSDTSTTTFSFIGRRYFGWVSDTSQLSTAMSDASIQSLPNELNESQVKSFTSTNPTGEKFFVFAYRSVSPDLASFKINGFESLSAMSSVTRSFTTATGFVGAWKIYWTKNPQTVSSLIETY